MGYQNVRRIFRFLCIQFLLLLVCLCLLFFVYKTIWNGMWSPTSHRSCFVNWFDFLTFFCIIFCCFELSLCWLHIYSTVLPKILRRLFVFWKIVRRFFLFINRMDSVCVSFSHSINNITSVWVWSCLYFMVVI